MSLIQRKYWEFLLPNTIMVFALSISEFVDVFLVSLMLGSEAMSVVNLGNPLILVASTISVLFSVGGGTLYARLVGEYRQQEATRVFTVSVLTGFCIVLFLTGLMLSCFQPLVSMLCAGNVETMAVSYHYIRILIFTLPLLAFANIIFGFLPAMGMPALSSTLLIAANVINLCLDVVYIKFLGMGVEGSALATVSGYSIALLVYLVLWWYKKIDLHLFPLQFASFNPKQRLKELVKIGLPSSLGQLSFAIKFAFCNAMALHFGGGLGLAILTVCIQLMSIASIFIGGIGSTFINLASFLNGQKDYQQIRRVGKLSYTLQFVCSIAYTALFCIFPTELAEYYNIPDIESQRLCAHAILLFSICLIPRGLTIIFMFYVQMLGKVVYASSISLIDGFVGIIPVCYLLCLWIGLDGLWLSFGVVNVLLFVLIIFVNAYIYHRHKNRYSSILLFEKNEDSSIESLSWSRLLREKDDAEDLVKSVCSPIKSNYINQNLIKQYLSSILKKKNKISVDINMDMKNGIPKMLNIRTSCREAIDFCSTLPENVNNIIALGMNCLQINIDKE